MTEDEMENEQGARPGREAGVAINEKHASITVVVPSHIEPSGVNGVSMASGVMASGVSVIEGGSIGGNINGGNINAVAIDSGGLGGVTGGHSLEGGRNLDKINNLAQKEIALGRVGVTREKAYRVIAQALSAMKWADVIDRQGNIKQEYVDDLDKQRWGAEMAIKMFGDMIERKEIEMDVGDKTLDRFRAMSVAELKARAADILLGKSKVVDAEVVR